MLTRDEAKTRVAKGAAYLDRVRPGWCELIDVGTLTLWRCGRCVVGQLGALSGLGWSDSVAAVMATADGCLSDHGFYIECEGSDVPATYQPLQDAWIDAIADRKFTEAAQSSKEPASTNAVGQRTDTPICVRAHDGLSAAFTFTQGEQ